jgi:hypothetical protein
VTLSWTKVGSDLTYTTFFKNSGASDSTYVNSAEGFNANSLVVSGLTAGTTYDFSVTASNNGADESVKANVV